MVDLEKIKKILTIINLLASANEIEQLLQYIIENATSVIDAEASSLLLFDDSKKNLYFYIATGEKGEEVKKRFELKKGQGIAGWVALYGKPLIVNNPKQDQSF